METFVTTLGIILLYFVVVGLTTVYSLHKDFPLTDNAPIKSGWNYWCTRLLCLFFRSSTVGYIHVKNSKILSGYCIIYRGYVLQSLSWEKINKTSGYEYTNYLWKKLIRL